MATEPTHSTTEKQDEPTRPEKRIITPIAEPLAKRPAARSNSKSASDYLATQNRIGLWNHQPLRKHRYVKFYTNRVCGSLVTLYTHFFNVNWSHFARSLEKISLTNSTARTHPEYCARIYVSHWLLDLYYTIRRAVHQVDPIAFVEKFHTETALFSDRYDHFLSTLNAAIRPTHIVGAVADEVYIPYLEDVNMAATIQVKWTGFIKDYTTFQLIHQLIELRKVAKMTPLSDDPMGRPLWLFDWPTATKAFTWFPQEGNYNDEDVTVAFLVGVACSPKLAIADIDEWRMFPPKTKFNDVRPDEYIRVTPRHWRGIAEFRILDAEDTYLANYFEKDKDKFKAGNIGPFAITSKDAATGITEATTSAETEVPDDEATEEYVPSSPRVVTRSQAQQDEAKFVRARVIDYCYYGQVIDRLDSATQFAAFKIFNNPN